FPRPRLFFFSSRRRHTSWPRDWSSDVCSSDLVIVFFSSLRAILAGAQGSLMHLGIGPIVTASIIMQLFAGAKIINLDLQDDEDKSVYQGTQKFLVIVMIFVEAIPQVFGFLTPSSTFVTNLNGSFLFGVVS